MFAGSLRLDEVATRAAALDVARLSALIAAARDPRDLLATLLTLPATEQQELCASVVAACTERRSTAAEFDAIVRIAAEFPGDFGMVVLLTMGYHHLPAGHYVRVPAGVLHTSVCGLTVEVQANSDNVVRAGLTPKETNVAELLRIVEAAGLSPDHVICSPALRTRQTFDGLGLDAPVEYERRVYDNDAEEILDLLRLQSAGTLLLIGHNPSMHRLVFGLSGGAEAHFPTSATAVIAFEGDWSDLWPGAGRLISLWTPRGD